MEFLIRRRKEVIIGLVFLLVLGFGGFYYFSNKKSVDELSVVSDDVDASKEETKNIETNKIFVDVKGAVKKPGVYELNDGDKRPALGHILSGRGQHTGRAYCGWRYCGISNRPIPKTDHRFRGYQ